MKITIELLRSIQEHTKGSRQLNRMKNYILDGLTNSEMIIEEQNYPYAVDRMTPNTITEIMWVVNEGDKKALEIQSQNLSAIEANLLATGLARYPNMPTHYGIEGVQHMDFVMNNGPAFIVATAKAYNALPNEDAKQGYVDTIRDMTIASIPPNHYFPMLEATGLDHITFAINTYWPEHLEYMTKRWLTGADKRPEEWLKNRLNMINNLLSTGQKIEADVWRKDTIVNLEKLAPELIKNISDDLRIETIQLLFPEVLDSIDEANLASQKNTNKMNDLIGKSLLVVGGLSVALILYQKATAKTPTTSTPITKVA